MVYKNKWFWFHIAAGMIGFDIAAGLGLSFLISFIIISILAVGWEYIEFYIECGGDWEKIEKIYGSKKDWFLDSLGDVMGALIFGSIIYWL